MNTSHYPLAVHSDGPLPGYPIIDIVPTIDPEPIEQPSATARRVEETLPFRGLLKSIKGSLDPVRDANLDWNVTAAPIQYLRHSDEQSQDWHTADGYRAIRRDDTGALLGVTSATFQPHQNSAIMADIIALANLGDAEILYAGELQNGRRIVAIARLRGDFGLPDTRLNGRDVSQLPDRTELYVIISGGHDIGTPLTVRALAYRLWCLNGAFFTVESKSKITITHRTALLSDGGKIRQAFDSIRAEFEQYATNAKRLLTTPTTPERNTLYVAELLQPGFAARFGESIGLTSPLNVQVYEETTAARALSLVDFVAANVATGFSRTLPKLVDSIYSQIGSNGANLWSSVNGITYSVDHIGGRSDATGVLSSLFGTGANLKQSALTTALTFAG